MNGLKTIMSSAKTIITLFVCSSILVGFMAISLSLTQSASAISSLLPQCPAATTSFNNEFCQTQPYLKCPSGQGFNLQDKCVGTGQPTSQPILTCPSGFELNDGICQTAPKTGNT